MSDTADTGDGPPQPPRRSRRGGIRRDPKWPNGRPGPNKGQKPFDPLSQTWTPMGQSWLAKRTKTLRSLRLEESQFLAKHFQLDPQGRLPEEEQAGNKGVKQRAEDRKKLFDFPPMPEEIIKRMANIIATYGLPLDRLSSDTAAFIMRRVMFDYFRLSNLRRTTKPPLFTPEELVELMRVLEVKPAQLAAMVQHPGADGRNNALGSIHRWMHGASTPTSILGIRLNRLIDQHVRRKGTGGFPGKTKGTTTSDKPETVARRERRTRVRKRDEEMYIPIARSAQEREEDADATERPDGE